MSFRANILILSVQVPFTRGGSEVLVDGLKRELTLRDYCTDIVSLPFAAQPKTELVTQMALWRSLELREFAGREVDLVIATKFPSYLVPHPCKVVWLIHQHRQLYELYGSRFGDFDTEATDETLRQMVHEADRIGFSECRTVCTISRNVSKRLKRYLDVDSAALCPPLPLGDAYRAEAPENYILSVGRLCSIKRVDLIIRAFAEIDDRLSLKIAGIADEPSIESYLKSEVDRHHLWHRVEFLGRVSDAELLSLYARAFAVYYAPFDEDYGFVTLEAIASRRPVITAMDSGTVLEYVEHEKNGLVTEAREHALAEACNRLLRDESLYARLSSAQDEVKTHSWDEIISTLTAPF